MVLLVLGTPRPELVVDYTAIRPGSVALAIGDAFGSSCVDAALSIGICSIFAATAISGDAAGGSLIAACAIAAAVLITVRARRHGPASGIALLVIYAAAYAARLT